MRLGIAALAMVVTLGCDRLDMYDQPRVEPYEASRFAKDGMSARPRLEDTIARGELREDDAFYRGTSGGRPVAEIPPQALEIAYQRRLTATRVIGVPDPSVPPTDAARRTALLDRGRDRFDIFCSACHGRLGDGDGMIVRRGFRRPPPFTLDRLRDAPAGHFFDVITNGFGAMPSYAARVEPADRWAITAYVRALQLRGDATLDDVPSDRRARINDSSADATSSTDRAAMTPTANSSATAEGPR